MLPLGGADAEAVGVAAKDDVGAATGHVGGYGDGAGLAGLRHNGRLALVLLCVEHLVGYASVPQHFAELLGLVDVGGAHQHGLAVSVQRLYIGYDGPVLGVLVLVDQVRLVLPDHWLVGGNLDYFKLVDLPELLGLGRRRTGHSGELFVQSEVVLEGDGGVGDGLAAHGDALFRLQGLVQAVGEAASGHEPPGELVHYHDLAVGHHVVAVALEDVLRP